MDFTFTSSIWVDEEDLDEMAERVAAGEDFRDVYNKISSGWEDGDWAFADCIRGDVKAEVENRIKEREA